MTNMDQFNRACALIFDKLYESFPIALSIDHSDWGFFEREDSSSELRMLLSSTFVFLADEGYISYNRQDDANRIKNEMRLTAKGLARLQRIPEGVSNSRKSLIEQLREAGSSIGGTVTGTAMSEAAKQVLRLIFGG